MLVHDNKSNLVHQIWCVYICITGLGCVSVKTVVSFVHSSSRQKTKIEKSRKFQISLYDHSGYGCCSVVLVNGQHTGCETALHFDSCLVTSKISHYGS